MEGLSIVPLVASDLDFLQQLGRETFSDAFASQNTPEDLAHYLESAFAKAVLEKQFANPDCHFYFIKHKEEIIGYLKLNTGDAQNELKSAIGLEIERIYIIADFQSKGIGTTLLNFAENQGRSWKKQYIWLGVWDQNPRAIAFYEKYNYVKFDTHTFTLGTDTQTDYLMRKILNE